MTFLNRVSISLGALALLLPIAGCGGGGGGASTVEELPAVYASAFCPKLDECFGPAAEIFLEGANCTDFLSQQLTDQNVPLWRAGIDSGTIIYHSDQVAACRNALNAASCEVIGGDALPAACEAVFEGTVAPAGTCRTNEECSGDAYCNQDTGCPGTCTARAAAGATCTQNDGCQAGLACTDGTCGTAPAIGGACGGPDGMDCGGDTNVCLGATDTAAGTCHPLADAFRVARGDACNPDNGELCVQGSTCALIGYDLATETTSWTCKAPASSGGTCQRGFPDPCPPSEYCDANPEATMRFDGSCQPLPTAGQPCRAGGRGDFGKACAPGLSCDGEICVTPGRLGDACSGEGACISRRCESGICAAPSCG